MSGWSSGSPVQRNRARVVVGTDFSEGASCALREARWLAERAGLELQVLHVNENGTPWRPDSAAWTWLQSAGVDPKVLLVRDGLPWVEIVRHAREVSAVVIVLGSYGESGFQAMTLGSTASRVALRAPCPVLFAAHRQERPLSDETSATSLHLL